LHLDAQRTWSRLETELGAALGVVQHGGFMVAETAEQVERLGRKIALEQAAGLSTELLDRAAVRTRAPYLGEAVIAAAFCAAEGKADPRRCALAYARAAMRLGAQVHARSGVQAMRRNGRRWHVTFDDGGVCQAEHVVIAAGAWSGRLAQMAGVVLPVSPVGLTMAATARTAPLITHLVQHAGRRLSMKQTPEGNILIGGGWPAALRQSGGLVDLDRRPELLLPSLAGNMAAAAAVVPAVGHLPVLRVWTGTTALVADQLPLIGEVPKAAGLFIATGGSAFTLGPTYARILADKILGRPEAFDARAYDPQRFGSLTLA
jgi:glycine/D-amino acid oxidase-like deaminating enzyme